MSQTTTTENPSLEVAPPSGAGWEALLDGPSRASLERILPAWIAARRWYRTKTKRVQSARVGASFHITDGPIDIARLLLVDLTLDDGQVDTYVLPVAFLHGDEAAQVKARRPQGIIAPLRVTGAAGRDGLLVDALVVEPVLRALLRALARGAKLTDGNATLTFQPLPHLKDIKDLEQGTSPARLVEGEQTNSSILFGTRFVGKVVRKLDPGESADLEAGRFLTLVGYTSTPALGAWASVQRGDEAPSTLVLMHAFVANHGDAWAHVLQLLDAWLTAAGQRDGAAPQLPISDVLTRAAGPLPADVTAVMGDHPAQMQLLGRRVGEMHVALAARPDDALFAPEPFDHETWSGLVATAQRDLTRTLDVLGSRGDALPEPARRSLASIRRRAGGFMQRLGQIAPEANGGVRMRVHGDLHLGQVLWTGQDFMIIDFEGEPARSLEERKSKRSPLVDVAGMLRSFHYAAVAAVAAKPEAERAALSPWASLWHRSVSAAFVRGWLDAVQGSAVLPPDPAVVKALLDLFLLEKSIYEVHYEMNNRPEWLDIPLQGVREIVGADRDAARGGPTAALVSASRIDPRSPAILAFHQGKATHAHNLLGAHPHQDGATDFAVWAPHAASVAVVGDFAEGEEVPLASIGESGLFAARVTGATPGHRYRYRIHTRSGEVVDKADPFATAAEVSPGTASVITSLGYAWGDATWMESRSQGARLDLPMSIYEVHLGSWRRSEGSDRPLSYREIAEPLAAHAKAMGFTHVELMPVLEHPYYGSWGYGVTGFFAATSRYGSPADLMFLVDTLHQAGLGVIFDWVPAHFARDAHGLASFDGAPLFEPDDPSRAVHPTWNTGLFDYARPEVRSFLLSSATYWVETFHADGLRVDGVESMLYLDHGQAQGAAARRDEAGISFLRELTDTLKTEHPHVVLAAEDSSAFPGVTKRTQTGGLGFDLKWDMGFSHDMKKYLSTDPIARSALQDKLTFRTVYMNNESFVLPLSHDDVIEERGGSLLNQMHGDAWQKLANLRLLYSLAFTEPGKKLLFMGDEIGQPGAWHHDRGLEWHLGNEPAHAGIARLVGDLNRLYKELPALHAGDASPGGFEWIDGSNSEMSIITFLRRGRADDDVVLVAFNGTPVPRHQYRIGVPYGGSWREVFNSDAPIYGGSGQGNLGGVPGVPYPWNGRPSSVVVTLPPLGLVILARGK
ncbi:MAG: 1,4-alpha-glucan (glycogen) branching enzyme GH3-type [Labilithrix sp.]|nr:1,4-alpha-glucan (glycogen) branching enzyme GH3-type [Labilithrix sp.]